MRNFFKALGAFLGIIVIVILVSWISTGNAFFLYKYFAPKEEQVRRETFEQSKAYNQGTIQELQNMQFQYWQSDTVHKALLGSIILHRAADYDPEKLKQDAPDLYYFIQDLKNEKKGKY
jgi:hypothetical protein